FVSPFEVPEGEIVALLGANGTGKTTTLRAISGVVHPSCGRIEFMGKRIDTLSPEHVVSLGIVQAPEGRQVFPELSVKENLLIGTYSRRDRSGIGSEGLRGVKDQLSQYGMEPVTVVNFGAADVDFSSQILKLIQAKPHAVIISPLPRFDGHRERRV
ncbi:MAG: ATP-binding cassette domain-containing protein, partial [Bacillota bacterium]